MALSSLSNSEYVLIIASYTSIFNSNGIDKKILNKKYSKQQLEYLKKTKTKQVQTLNVIFNKDVEELKHPYFNYLFKAYNNYEKTGHYPNGKSLNEQNNKLIEIFDIFAAMYNESELNRLKEQERLNNVRSKNRR